MLFRARSRGTYLGYLGFLGSIWGLVALITVTWIHRCMRVAHDQLRTQSTVVNNWVSYRYWLPAWWAVALPMVWRPWVLLDVVRVGVTRGSSSHALSRLVWSAGWAMWIEGGTMVWFLLEVFALGCRGPANPWLACQPDIWCHVHYKDHPEFCSNGSELKSPPWEGLHTRYEWRFALAFAVMGYVMAVLLRWVAHRLEEYKAPPASSVAAGEEVRRTWVTHAWFLSGQTVVTVLYVAWAVRAVTFQHEYVRSPSKDSPFLSERYNNLAWYVHALGVILQPLVVTTGVAMLTRHGWGVSTDSHLLAASLAVIDAILRIVYSVLALHTCNGNIWWSNTCHSGRNCCLRFDEWMGNGCAGVGLLYGNTTTPANDKWACNPPLISTQQLDRDAGFTAVFAITGFALFFDLALVYNWYRYKAWTRQAAQMAADEKAAVEDGESS